MICEHPRQSVTLEAKRTNLTMLIIVNQITLQPPSLVDEKSTINENGRIDVLVYAIGFRQVSRS